MSLRKKINVVGGFEYDHGTRRFLADRSEDSSVGFYANGKHAWMTNGQKLSVIDVENKYAWSNYCFNDVLINPVEVTCVEELIWDPSGLKASCLLVGISSHNHSQICVFNAGTSRVVRAVQLDNLQIRCMAVVNSNTSSPLNSLTDVLSAMDGVLAVGCANGAVILLDLNLQYIGIACNIYAERKYQCDESSPMLVKYVTVGSDTEATITEIEEYRNEGFSPAITLIDGDNEVDDFGVTALTYSKETGCLFIGYSSGLWQIWNLSFPNLNMMYECAECTNPVASFTQIEPCEDPRPTIYVWVNHEGTETALPIFNMYSLCYQDKRIVPNYGIFYVEFICCNLSFSMDPSEYFADIAGGRLISAQSCAKSLKRHLPQNMNLPEMEGIQMRLILMTFSMITSQGDSNSFLCVFDLDQWYKEQMPFEACLSTESSYIEIVKLSANPLLASLVLTDTISLYHAEEPQEIHRAPQALNYEILVADNNGITHFEKLGIQTLWLKNTELIGASSLVHPTKLFHASVSAGLIPTFPAHLDPESPAPTNDEMRSYILSVILDHGLITVIFKVAEQWETGVYGISNCSLTFLFDWVWSSVMAAYSSFNQICNTLFSASGLKMDNDIWRRMEHTRIILDRLYQIQVFFCGKYINNQFNRDMEQRMKALSIIKLYVDHVIWFVRAGLLPEVNSKGLPKSSIKYDFKKLDQYATERRKYLNGVVNRLRKVGKAHDLPGGGLYLIDHFVHDYPELRKQWEDERGDCSSSYPPASVQSLLRTLRLQSVPQSKKLAVLQYGILDVMNTVDKEKYEEQLNKLADRSHIPDISISQFKVINALWHLDHSLYEEGLSLLFDRYASMDDLSESIHRAILRLLLYEGQVLLALQYLRSKHPPLTLPDDIKLEMSIILARKQTIEAYQFQRRHGQLRDILLQQLFSECLANGEIGHLVELPLDDYEVRFLDSFLAKNRNQRNDSLRVVILLTRHRYLEAETLHERLSATCSDYDPVKMDTLNLIVKGLTKDFPLVAKEMYRQSINPELKNHPAFTSAKPLPLSRFVKTLSEKNRLYCEPIEQFCAAVVATTANLWNSVKQSDPQFKIEKFWTFDDEPADVRSGNAKNSTASSLRPEIGSEGRKRSANWMLGSNKRQKLDADSASCHDSIASIIGTPLVKRKSDGETYPATNTPLSKGQVQSILKSNKTPGTPFSQIDDEGTPKKTLRWDIPGASSQKVKSDIIKKSLISSTLLTPTKEETIKTPEPSASAAYAESIKSRLRSHSSSFGIGSKNNWDEIAEQAKSKAHFSVDLPAKREDPETPKKPRGTSFVKRVEALEQKQKQLKETGIVEAQSAETSENDSFSSSAPLMFDGLPIFPDDVAILAQCDSPFPTEIVSKKTRSKIEAYKKRKQAQKLGATDHSEGMDVDTSVSAAPVESQELPLASKKTDSGSTSCLEVPQLPPSAESNIDLVKKAVDSVTKEIPSVEKNPSDAIKPSCKKVVETPQKLPLKEQNLRSFNLGSPKEAAIVSLSRNLYPEDEDEEGSEDPEEAEIPPVMEFSQMEEGLVMDSYSLQQKADQPKDEKRDDPEEENIEEEMNQDDVPWSPSDKSSSVICLDSDSEGEPRNETQLDYNEYEEDSYPSDEDSYPSERSYPERRRSFFHDKYNLQPDSERGSQASGENQQQEEDKQNADVDLYNMEEYNQDELEGDNFDLFDVGRDLQVRSEGDEEEEVDKTQNAGQLDSKTRPAATNEGEEEGGDDEQVEEEEWDDDSNSEPDSVELISSESDRSSLSHLESQEAAEAFGSSHETSDKPSSSVESSQDVNTPEVLIDSKMASKTTLPSKEIIESAEEIRIALSQETESMSEVTPAPNDGTKDAVNALLGLNDPRSEDINEVDGKEEITVQTVEMKGTEHSEIPVPNVTDSSPSKADDVISMLMSPDQMFFGTSEDTKAQNAELKSCKTLFSYANRQESECQPREKENDKVEPVDVSNEDLELKLDESDVQADGNVHEAEPDDNAVISSPQISLSAEPMVAERSPAKETKLAIIEPETISSSQEMDPPESARSSSSKFDDASFKTAQSEISESHSPKPIQSDDQYCKDVTISRDILAEAVRLAEQPEELAPPETIDSSLPGRPQIPSESVIDPLVTSETQNMEIHVASDDGVGHGNIMLFETTPDLHEAQTAPKILTAEVPEMPKPDGDNYAVVLELPKSDEQVVVGVESELCPDKHPTDKIPTLTVNEMITVEVVETAKDHQDAVEVMEMQSDEHVGVEVDTQYVPTTTAIHGQSGETESGNLHGPLITDTVVSSVSIVESVDVKNVVTTETPGESETQVGSVPSARLAPSTEIKNLVDNSRLVSKVDSTFPIIEPPTPFKNMESKLNKQEDSEFLVKTDTKRDISEGSAVPSDLISTGDESINPNDVAFVGDQSIPLTPISEMTPLRKSSRLRSRLSTPGRALVPDAELIDSPSVLDVAVYNAELSDGKPQMVDRSMVTDDVVKPSQRSSKISKSKPAEKQETEETTESNVEKKRLRQSSAEPEMQVLSNEVDQPKKKSRRSLSIEPEGTPMKEQLVQISSPQRRSRRSSSKEPAPLTPSQPEKKNQRKTPSHVDEIKSEKPVVRHSPRVKPKFDYTETPLSDSGTSSASSSVQPPSSQQPETLRVRRASSLEPSSADNDRRRNRRASSEVFDRPSSRGSSSKRTSADVDFDDHEKDVEYKKRKTKHSITEPLKKRASSSGEPSSSRLSSDRFDSEVDPPPKKRGRPRITLRPSTLASIQEVPEAPSGVQHDRWSKNFKDQLVKTWIAEAQQHKRISRSSIASGTRRRSQSTSESDFIVPMRDAPSPTDSVSSAASTSSMVLRPRKVSDVTPTKRTRKSTSKKSKDATTSSTRSTRGKKKSSVSRGVDFDNTIVEEDGEDSDDNQSMNRTSSDAGDFDESAIEESRATRRQRSILDRSLTQSSASSTRRKK